MKGKEPQELQRRQTATQIVAAELFRLFPALVRRGCFPVAKAGAVCSKTNSTDEIRSRYGPGSRSFVLLVVPSRLFQVTLHSNRHQQLPYVALRMFGSMYK